MVAQNTSMSSLISYIKILDYTGFYGREKLREKLKFFCNFWSRTFALETFAARLLWGEESFVHGTGRMRRRDGLLFIEQRQQASTPFTRHRDTQKYGNQFGDAQPVLYAFNQTKKYHRHTLCCISCGRRLSRHTYVVYTAGPSQAIHLVVKVF